MNAQTLPQQHTHKSPVLVLQAERSPFNREESAPPEELEGLFHRVSKSARKFHRFVGFLCDHDTTYICLPKVFFDHLPSPADTPPHAWLKRAHLLRRALIRYQKEERGQRSVELLKAYVPDRSRPDQRVPASHLALAEQLLSDFKRHGLWRSSQHAYTRSGSGHTHWPRTLSRGGEFFVQQGGQAVPIYPDPITRQRQLTYDHPLTLAQLAVLHDLKALYGPIIHEGELHLPPVSLSAHSHKSLPAIGQALKRAQRGLFEQRARHLSHLLLSYIELDDRGRKDQVDVFGTTSFEVLFEHMCLKVLGADPKLILKDQSLSKVQWSFDARLQGLIGHSERTGSDQRVDLLNAVAVEGAPPYTLFQLISPQNQALDHLLVLDAKYYDVIGALKHTKDQKESAQHLPQIEDVRKQYAYSMWLSQKLDIKEDQITNGLLFPTFGLEMDAAGEATQRDDLSASLQAHSPFDLLGTVRMGDSRHLLVLGMNLDRLMHDYAEGRRYAELRL